MKGFQTSFLLSMHNLIVIVKHIMGLHTIKKPWQGRKGLKTQSIQLAATNNHSLGMTHASIFCSVCFQHDETQLDASNRENGEINTR